MDTKELSYLVDEYIEVREERLAADRTAEALKKKENILQTSIIGTLRADALPAGVGTLATVRLQQKDKYICEDWQGYYNYIRANDAFDLLHKRVTESAIKLRMEDGIVLPGIVVVPDFSLSISNLKK